MTLTLAHFWRGRERVQTRRGDLGAMNEAPARKLHAVVPVRIGTTIRNARLGIDTAC